MKYKLLGLLLLAGLLLPAATWAGTALPATPAWEFNTPGNNYTDGNWTFGEVFTANANIWVGYLGYYNQPGGMNDTHPVGIFDAAGNLLTSTVVTGGSPYSTANFLWNPVSPVELLAGDTYVIEGVSNSDLYTWNDPGFTVYSPITILGNNWILGNGLNFNGTGLINDVSDGYWGADFAPTPEPSSFLLLGSGLAALAGLVRRKMRI